MNTSHHKESVASDVWQEKIEQLQNELVLAQYEAQKWKEKYHVEKRRRQMTARDLLNLVMLTDRFSNEKNTLEDVKTMERSLSSSDHIVNLLSPTLSSFDFDDDSSEDASDDSRDQSPETLSNIVEATKGESEPLAETAVESIQNSNSSSNDGGPHDSSLALEQLDQQSTMYHTNTSVGISGRVGRSSTTGSLREALGGSSRRVSDVKSEHLKQQHLMYRILYANSSSRDLWHARIHPHNLKNVACSIMFSTHMKKERVFEHFFVVGTTQNVTELCSGYYKPKLLYHHPNHISDSPDESVADFCFPRGVPSIMCTPAQAKSIQGVAVSKWFTDIESLQDHIKEVPSTSGYTFRLTGAKGEILYGFCVAVMKNIAAENLSKVDPMLTSPRIDRMSDQIDNSIPSISTQEKNTNLLHMMAPICFCFTSKFPFYRLHFTLLRMIVENELEQYSQLSNNSVNDSKKEAEYTEQYEIILRPQLNLVIEFTIYHEENFGVRDQFIDSESNQQKRLNSIASKLDISLVDGRVVLSEDAPKISGANQSSFESKKLSSQLRKSFSTDNIDNCKVVNGWILDKPMVKSVGLTQPKEYEGVKVGDILESIDSIATASMSFEQTQALLEKGTRPMRLHFRRSASTQISMSTTEQKQPDVLLPTSVDILHRARRIKINDPGHWSSARLPTFEFSYQFPKRQSDRWAVGVVLRFLSPDKVVEIIANLLLEKQVVIMSECPAKVSAVCTALLLLLSPFQWQSTYIPLLPSNLLDFLHSPVPFLVGCHSSNETSEWSDVCFYDIDNDNIVAPAATGHWSPELIFNGVELCRLLRKARDRFCALSPSGKPWYELSEEEDTIITLTMQEAEIFLRDMGFDISYQDLAASIPEGQSLYDRLQEEVAKEVRNSIYEDFLDEFTKTQLFCQYYESLLQPEAQRARKNMERMIDK